MKLCEITDDDMPLLVRIIWGLPKDAKIFYQLPRESGFSLGPLDGIYADASLPSGSRGLRITYTKPEPDGRIPAYNLSFLTRADDFDEKFKLEKKLTASGKVIWILHDSTTPVMDISNLDL